MRREQSFTEQLGLCHVSNTRHIITHVSVVKVLLSPEGSSF